MCAIGLTFAGNSRCTICVAEALGRVPKSMERTIRVSGESYERFGTKCREMSRFSTGVKLSKSCVTREARRRGSARVRYSRHQPPTPNEGERTTQHSAIINQQCPSSVRQPCVWTPGSGAHQQPRCGTSVAMLLEISSTTCTIRSLSNRAEAIFSSAASARLRSWRFLRCGGRSSRCCGGGRRGRGRSLRR